MGLIPVGAATILAVIFFIFWLKERKVRIHYQTPPIPRKKEYYVVKNNKPVLATFNEWVLAGKSKVLKKEEPYLDSVVLLRFLGVSKGISARKLPLLFEVVFYYGDFRLVILYSDNYESALTGFDYAVKNAENFVHGRKK